MSSTDQTTVSFTPVRETAWARRQRRQPPVVEPRDYRLYLASGVPEVGGISFSARGIWLLVRQELPPAVSSERPRLGWVYRPDLARVLQEWMRREASGPVWSQTVALRSRRTRLSPAQGELVLSHRDGRDRLLLLPLAPHVSYSSSELVADLYSVARF